MARQRFDQKYYRRFYKTDPVHTEAQIHPLVLALDSLAKWWGYPIRSVLETGAGLGLWRNWYRSHRQKVRVLSTDQSEYACRTYGHEQRDLSRWFARRPFDLVVCQSVLQYLSDADAASAIRNLGLSTRHFLYFEVPTLEDYRETLDKKSTDLRIHLRSAAWYRRRLSQDFTEVGASIWLKKTAPVILYELERTKAGKPKPPAKRSPPKAASKGRGSRGSPRTSPSRKSGAAESRSPALT